MYIRARQIERYINIYKHKTVEDAIKETAQTMLDQLKNYLRLTQDDKLDTSAITIELLFASKDESDLENAQKLQYLIDNVEEVITKLKPTKVFMIGTYDDPSYSIEIYKDNREKIRVSSYSNLEDNFFWDEAIEWIE